MGDKRKMIVEIDGKELAVLMCEASYQIKRPANLTAEQAFDAMDDDVRDGWARAARVACEYITAKISTSPEVQ